MLARTIHREVEETNRQRAGEVIGLEGERFMVRCSDLSLVAERAVSCLVTPRIGDRVLLASVGAHEHYLLAVLRRPDDDSIELAARGDVKVVLPSGRFDVCAERGVGLSSPREVSLVGKEIELQGVIGRFAVERLSLLGSQLDARFGALRAVASDVDAVFERVVQRLKHGYRFVEKTDRLDAENIELNASATTSVRTRDAVMLAEDLIKLDGEQIHVG
jgi:hypothetical protein